LIDSILIDEEKVMLSENKLFTEVSSEESASVSGGGFVTSAFYLILSSAPFSPGGVTITPQEENTAWLLLLNMIAPPGAVPSP
jgi:hypothetical protein